jgi:hypothetical protein
MLNISAIAPHQQWLFLTAGVKGAHMLDTVTTPQLASVARLHKQLKSVCIIITTPT